MSKELKDPFGEIAVLAVQLHEMYVSFTDAGFHPDQAFQLARDVLNSGLTKPRD